MSNLHTIMAEAENRYRVKIYEATWGHLAPEKNKTYRGTITIAFGNYHSGHINPIILEEVGMPENSPWWYEAVHEYISNLVRGNNDKEWDSGYVLKLNITFRNFQFWLTNTQVLVRPTHD